MRWYQDLYTGIGVKEDRLVLIREIEEGTYRPELYLITLAMNGTDLMDIRKVRSLYRDGLKEELPLVVGIAKGYRDAVRLVERIISDCWEKTGDVDLRQMFGI